MAPCRNEVRPCLLLAAAVALAHANGLAGVFQFDDYKVIVANPVVHGWHGWLADLGHGIRPLLKLSYLLNWLSGAGTPGFHAANLLIHFGNALLLFRLARRFLTPGLDRSAADRIALFAALLFAVHPVHTEAVTYICGRSSSLMTLFYLAGLLVHLESGEGNPGFRRGVLVPLAFLAAVACKETAVTFPLALLFWDVCEGRTLSQGIRRQLPTLLLAVAVTAAMVGHPAYRAMLVNSAGLHSLSTNLSTAVGAGSYLLRQWLWPVHLNIDPDLRPITTVGKVLPQMTVLAALAVVSWLQRRQRPWLLLACGWAFLHLVPLHLLLPRQDIANERQLYLAGIGLFLAFAAETGRMPRRRWTIAAAGLLLTLTLLTALRNRDYGSEIALWESTARLSPGKARVHNNLGYAYMLAARTAEARREYEAALAIDPAFLLARDNLRALARP
ncbi:MAG: hypothetical protein AB1568_12290 [Thermodesulfobacteriota bacterium]